VPAALTYATVPKEREGGRVVSVQARAVFGTMAAVLAAVSALGLGTTANTAHVERCHGTDRSQKARKVRKTYSFSKDWEVHEAVGALVRFSYNLCWPVRTLRVRVGKRKYQQRTPAMAAGLSDHIWSLKEWLSFPGIKKISNNTNKEDRLYGS
jgi:hypothetical protein